MKQTKMTIDNGLPKSRTIVLLGDSITDYCGPKVSGDTFYYYNTNGYFPWANMLLNQPFTQLYNAGIAGNTLTQILARIQSEVIIYHPGYCMILGGTQDVGQAESAADIISRLSLAYYTLRKAGIQVIASTIPPSSTFDETENAVRDTVNAWILAQPGIIAADMATAIDDGAGAPIAGYTLDGTHPSGIGGYYMGVALAAAILPKIRQSDIMTMAAGSNIINTNPLMEGDSSGLATGYTKSGSPDPTVAKVERTDGKPGEWQQFAVSERAETNFALNSSLMSTGFSVGDVIWGQAEINLSSLTDLKYCYMQILCLNSGYSTIQNAADGYQTDETDDLDLTGYSGILRTPEITIPENTVYLRIQFKFNGVGTFQFGRNELRKK